MKKPAILLFAWILAPLSAPSQTPVPLDFPRNTAGAEESSATFFWSPAGRFQVVLPAAGLSPLRGTRLRLLEFPNWTFPSYRTKAGDAFVRVKAARAAFPPSRASRVFSANLGNRAVLLASGPVHFKDSTPYKGSGPTPWGDARNFRISLAGNFVYTGGDLVLDILVRAVAGKPLPFWLGRALSRKIPARETLFGSPTGGTVGEFRPSVYGALAPGERTLVTLEGIPAGAPAFLFLGTSNSRFLGLPLPMPAAFSGGKTVYLRTSPDLAFPTIATKYPLPPSLAGGGSAFFRLRGEAAVTLDFPWDPSFLGGALFAQWFSLGVMGPGEKVENRLASTQGVRIPLLPASADLGAAFLSAESQDPKADLKEARSRTLRFLPAFRLVGVR